MKHSLPEIEEHEGVIVVRDTLVGGTKSRYLWQLYLHHDEVIYASSAEGSGQVALAAAAKRWDKRAIIYGPARKILHPRQVEAIELGADFRPIKPGYMSACAAKARAHAEARGSFYLPFGAVTTTAVDTIADVAIALKLRPTHIWATSGSGTLIRGLRKAWPKAEAHAVQVGHQLSSEEVAGAQIHESLYRYSWCAPSSFAPFDCDGNYERKGWRAMMDWKSKVRPKGRLVFWSVMSGSEGN